MTRKLVLLGLSWNITTDVPRSYCGPYLPEIAMSIRFRCAPMRASDIYNTMTAVGEAAYMGVAMKLSFHPAHFARGLKG